MILDGTKDVEIHFLNLINPNDERNLGNIFLSAYQTNSDGSITELLERTELFQDIVTQSYVEPEELQLNLDPNYVGSVLISTFQIPLNNKEFLSKGSLIALKFPAEFELPDDGTLAATLQCNKKTGAGNVDTSATGSMNITLITFVYT